MKRGFTLLELLIATALVAVASAVILGGFAAGIRVWERAREFAGPATAARLAVAVVRKDLSNMLLCRAATFKGGGSWVEFPAVVSSGGSNLWPGTIRYEFSQYTMRRISGVMEGAGNQPETSEVLLSEVRDVLFSYGDAGVDGQGDVTWLREWAGRTNLPVAVKCVVRFLEGKEEREIRQTVLLPRGYPVKDERSRK